MPQLKSASMISPSRKSAHISTHDNLACSFESMWMACAVVTIRMIMAAVSSVRSRIVLNVGVGCIKFGQNPALNPAGRSEPMNQYGPCGPVAGGGHAHFVTSVNLPAASKIDKMKRDPWQVRLTLAALALRKHVAVAGLGPAMRLEVAHMAGGVAAYLAGCFCPDSDFVRLR